MIYHKTLFSEYSQNANQPKVINTGILSLEIFVLPIMASAIEVTIINTALIKSSFLNKSPKNDISEKRI